MQDRWRRVKAEDRPRAVGPICCGRGSWRVPGSLRGRFCGASIVISPFDLGAFLVHDQVAAWLPKVEQKIGRARRPHQACSRPLTLQVNDIAIEAAPGQTGSGAAAFADHGDPRLHRRVAGALTL